MTDRVIDASVAIKWVVDEDGTARALSLLRRYRLIAPDLLLPECANILWKKVQRQELLREEARMAVRLIQTASLELLPMRQIFEKATQLSIDLGHPAYDCFYLVAALEYGCPFVTADDRLVRKLAQVPPTIFDGDVRPLMEI
ncbi:MAG: type II toxin-antitoxin system VapC family toxin [Azospirillaceae bacterium]|nr:type II toxin-antitoxin system VapC family toxin [Azospirillaceae bacterium]